MWRVTLKGLLAKKLRLVLTSIAVVLGVAFMSGTFVLTDTLGAVFDDLFSQQAEDIDAVVRAPSRRSATTSRASPRATPCPESLLETVESVDGVAAAEGSIFGFATVVGRDGDIGAERWRAHVRVLVAVAAVRQPLQHDERLAADLVRRDRDRREHR